MFIRSVVHDEIKDDAYVFFSTFRRHGIEVGERPIHRINVFVVGHIVAEIYLRRREAGRDPDRVHAEIVQIPHFRSNALQVADAVVIAVGKTARIELIEDGVLPPLMAFGVQFLLR